MKLHDVTKPEIGHWYFFCCEHDLYQIENAEDIEEVMRDDVVNYQVFASKESALKWLGLTSK